MARGRAALVALVVATAWSASPADARAQKKSVNVCVGNFEEAQLKEKRGKLVAARELYEACADPKCPSLVRKDCSAKRDEIDRVVPTITIVVRDPAGNDVADAALAIDGTTFSGDRSRAFPIDPGPHVITYTLPGRPPADEKVTIYEGEKARVVTIAAKEAAPATQEPEPAPAPSSQSAPISVETGGRSLLAPLIVGGVGVVLLAAGVGLEILAGNDQSSSEAYQAKAADPAQSATREENLAASTSHHDSAKRDQLFAVIAGGAGIVAIGIGVVLYFVQPAKKTAAFAPLVRASAAGGSLGFVF